MESKPRRSIRWVDHYSHKFLFNVEGNSGVISMLTLSKKFLLLPVLHIKIPGNCVINPNSSFQVNFEAGELKVHSGSFLPKISAKGDWIVEVNESLQLELGFECDPSGIYDVSSFSRYRPGNS